MVYKFIQLDPRAGAQNPTYDLGIEVTMKVPEGTVNLDHHGPGATAETPSACEQALIYEPLPEDGATLATVRPDQDSIAAMAVFESRRTGRPINTALLKEVALFDRYGPKSESNLTHYDLIVAIARRSADFRFSMADRVAFVQSCLDGTVDMSEVARLVAERNAEFAAAEAASEVVEVLPGKLVFVQSTHRFATNIGYRVAPTVVAFNPQMPETEVIEGKPRPTGQTYKKFTVCRYDSNVPTDLVAVAAELQAMDKDWGGRGDIYGSPQNRDCNEHPMTVVAVVARHTK